MEKKTVDYLIKKVPKSLWKKIQHKTINLGITIKQFVLEALKEKVKK